MDQFDYDDKDMEEMTDVVKEKGKKIGGHVATATGTAGIVMILISFGLVGPGRDATVAQAERRMATLEATQVSQRIEFTARLDGIEKLIDQRMTGVEAAVRELKMEIRKSP